MPQTRAIMVEIAHQLNSTEAKRQKQIDPCWLPPRMMRCSFTPTTRTATPPGVTTAQLALRWVIDQPGVSVVIPGARTAGQARANAEAADVRALDDATLSALETIYDERIHRHVHARW